MSPGLRRLRTIVLLLLSIAVLAVLMLYAVLPRLLPAVAREFLPDDVIVDELITTRPGRHSVRVVRARLRILDASGETVVAVDEATLHYGLLSRTLQRIAAERVEVLLPAPTDGVAAELQSALVLPALPVARIELAAGVVGRAGSDEALLNLTDARLDARTDEWRVRATMSSGARPGLRVDATLGLDSGATLASVDAGVVVGDGKTPAIDLALSMIAFEPERVTADWVLVVDSADLAALASVLATPWDGLAGAHATLSARGRLAQTPEEWRVTLETPGPLEITPGPAFAPAASSSAPIVGLGEALRPLAAPLLQAERLSVAATGPVVLSLPREDGAEAGWSVEGPLALAAAGPLFTVAYDSESLSVATGPAAASLATQGRFDLDYRVEGVLALPGSPQPRLKSPMMRYTGGVAVNGGKLVLLPAAGSRLGAAELTYESALDTPSPTRWQVPAFDTEVSGRLEIGRGDDEMPVARGQLSLNGGAVGRSSLLEAGLAVFAIDGMRFALDAEWSGEGLIPRLRGRIDATALEMADAAITSGATVLDLREARLAELSVKADLSTRAVQVRGGDLLVSLDRVAGALSLDRDSIQLSGSAWPRAVSRAQPLELSFDTTAGEAIVQLPALDLELADVRPLIRQLVNPTWPGLSVESLAAKGALRLDVSGDEVQGKGEILLSDVTATLDKLRVIGATDTIEIESLTPLALRHTVDVPALELGSDLGVSGLQLTLTSVDAKADLSNLRARLLEGSLALPEATMDEEGFGPATVQLEQIDLTRLLGWLDIKGLEGSGLLDAALPMRARGAAVIIEDGTFESQASGAIRYQGEAGAALLQNNIALQALRDFRFEELSGTLDYAANGDYAVGLSITGANPTLYDGYPIRLNLNLTGKLPGALQAALLTGDFTGSIIRQLRAGKLEPSPEDE